MKIYCKELEFRFQRDIDRFEVGCSGCGNKTETTGRRWPREDYIEYLVSKICTCGDNL